MDWVGVSLGFTMVSTWGLAKCTIFSKEFERERLDHLLRNFEHKDSLAKMTAEWVVREYRLRVIPLWLIASAASWAWLIFILRAQ